MKDPTTRLLPGWFATDAIDLTLWWNFSKEHVKKFFKSLISGSAILTYVLLTVMFWYAGIMIDEKARQREAIKKCDDSCFPSACHVVDSRGFVCDLSKMRHR